MESVDKLRGIICDVNVAEISANIQQPIGTGREVRVSPAWVDSWQRAAERALDEIEQELADRYVALPLDAVGEPWRIGDVVDKHGKVHGMGLDVYGWHFVGVDNAINPELYCHAKPRTTVDVLADFAAEVERGHNDYETARRYAEEIRELLEEE